MSSPTVAVVGLGALGLVAVKNLSEEGFNVVGFERNNWVGGLWHFTQEDKTSILRSTTINISKERGCFTDFPFADDVPSHASGADVQRYLEQYVEHFNLSPKLRLGSDVKLVTRDENSGKWQVQFENAPSQYFDKVVMATGNCQEPLIPELPGIGLFQGQTLHSRAFKSGECFKGKRVVVVGIANTAADTVQELTGWAKEIYISHRHGAIVIQRLMNGVPFDHSMTLRKASIGAWLGSYLPNIGEFAMNKGVASMQRATHKGVDFLPEWNLSPAPSLKHAVPIVSDNLVENLRTSRVKSIGGIEKVVNPYKIQLKDGSQVDVDVIIWCTGYKSNFNLIDPAVDPTRNTTPAWATLPGSKGKPLPRLYQNIFSLDYPESLAFMGGVAFVTGAFPLYDLASMAIAQIWTGKSALPSLAEMDASVDAQHEFTCNVAKEGSVLPQWVKEREWMAWANDAAGTGLNEYLGWGWQSWVFWLKNRKTYKLLMDGIYTPHVFRVFDQGKRKVWGDALTEIERVNESVAQLRKRF